MYFLSIAQTLIYHRQDAQTHLGILLNIFVLQKLTNDYGQKQFLDGFLMEIMKRFQPPSPLGNGQIKTVFLCMGFPQLAAVKVLHFAQIYTDAFLPLLVTS